MKAADEQIRMHPSVAEDSGTESRRSQHLLTRLLNCVNGQVEVGGQTAALALIGFPSNIMSHGFTFVFIKSAVEYAHAAHAILPPLSITASSRQTLLEGLPTSLLEDEDLYVDAERNEDEDDVDGDGACDVARAGDAIALVTQHLDYAHRGEQLRSLSLFQWCGIICITDKRRPRVSRNSTQADNEDENDDEIDEISDVDATMADAEDGAQAASVQRPTNAQFPFSAVHVGRASKTQRLFTKQLVCQTTLLKFLK